MNDLDKIERLLNGLKEDIQTIKSGQQILEAGQEALQAALGELKKDLGSTKDVVLHLNTALKALPTKQETEEIVETAVDAAKSELRSDILLLDAKIVRKIPSLEHRVRNIEEQEGIENPEKH